VRSPHGAVTSTRRHRQYRRTRLADAWLSSRSFVAGGLSRDEKKRVAVIFVLFLFAVVFWGAFEQAPTSLNLVARDFTDRQVGGFESRRRGSSR
jgi:dipeptide/tripeptide permease